MNRSSLPIIIVVALVAGAIGWFAHTPPAPSAEKAPPAAVDTTKSAPAAVAPAAVKVAAPSAAPAPVAKSSSPAQAAPVMAAASAPAAPATTPASAPAAPGVTPPELSNVIMEITNLAQSGDFVSLYENYESPQKMAALTAEQKTFIENQIRQQMSGPNGASAIQGQVAILQALSNTTPTMNSAGDHATFQVPTPTDLAPAGTNLPPTIPINFVKVDGRWYLDQ